MYIAAVFLPYRQNAAALPKEQHRPIGYESSAGIIIYVSLRTGSNLLLNGKFTPKSYKLIYKNLLFFSKRRETQIQNVLSENRDILFPACSSGGTSYCGFPDFNIL
jgi:hypothetical protein